MDIVGTQVCRHPKASRCCLLIPVFSKPRIRKTNADPNIRHSFNGSEIQLDFNESTPTTATQTSQFGLPSDTRASRINGHVRSGSAGNWGSTARINQLTAYPLSSIPGGDTKSTMPWADYPASRRTENNWA
jgi:hypothetical protein